MGEADRRSLKKRKTSFAAGYNHPFFWGGQPFILSVLDHQLGYRQHVLPSRVWGRQESRPGGCVKALGKASSLGGKIRNRSLGFCIPQMNMESKQILVFRGISGQTLVMAFHAILPTNCRFRQIQAVCAQCLFRTRCFMGRSYM